MRTITFPSRYHRSKIPLSWPWVRDRARWTVAPSIGRCRAALLCTRTCRIGMDPLRRRRSRCTEWSLPPRRSSGRPLRRNPDNRVARQRRVPRWTTGSLPGRCSRSERSGRTSGAGSSARQWSLKHRWWEELVVWYITGRYAERSRRARNYSLWAR